MYYYNFVKNWNNKLSCTVYTTIRRHNPHLRIGQVVEIKLNRVFLHKAEIIGLVNHPLEEIPKMVVMQDTGYNYDSSIELFRRFLKKDSILQARRENVDLIYLRKLK